MSSKIVFLLLVSCVVIAKTKDCHDNTGDRFKRSKYFPYPPPGAVKYYKKPPMVFHPGIPGFGGNGVISYTPPPNYMEEDNTRSQSPYGYRPYVSRRPTNDGLGDEDINNIVKYLSKQDLDKIIEYAGERDGNKRPIDLERDIEVEFNGNLDATKYISKPTYGQKDEGFSLNGPFRNGEDKFQINYNSNSQDFANKPLESMLKYRTVFNPNIQDNNNIRPNNQNYYTHAQESVQFYKVAYPGPLQEQASNIQESIQSYKPNTGTVSQASNIANDKDLDQEEYLPKPVNLRDDPDIEGEDTKNIEVTASPTYKVESFGDLPVMDYHSKRFSVSSYNVPHYSITSNSRATNSPAVESAPDKSAASANSDAHLKAVRIWTHRSTGKAYTLHKDGSLSVERPLRPKRSL